MLPFEPESDIELMKRYPQSVTTVSDGTWFPALCRKNVFDFRNGLRLVVSNDNLPGSHRSYNVIHLSARIMGGTPFEHRIKVWPLDDREQMVRRYVERLARSIFGLSGLRYVWFDSEKGVLHWLKSSD